MSDMVEKPSQKKVKELNKVWDYMNYNHNTLLLHILVLRVIVQQALESEE